MAPAMFSFSELHFTSGGRRTGLVAQQRSGRVPSGSQNQEAGSEVSGFIATNAVWFNTKKSENAAQQ
jgi:hypothetical protein